VRSLPNGSPEEPIKNNILWLLMRYRMDIDIMYRTLQNIRPMPTGKDKYRSIERAIKALDKEGWPIDKEMDNHGIAWFGAGPKFMDFVYGQILTEANDIIKKSKMREIKRLNDVLELENKIEKKIGINY